MSGQPLVSVCIANHDYGRFVGAAVDSALAQSWPHVEVVVVDDGSTDDSLAVLQAYGDRIRLLAQDNGGQGAALNAAFAASRGEVVLFLDADDVLLPTVVEQAVGVLRADPEVVDVQFVAELVDADGRSLGETVPRRPELLGSGDLREVVLRRRCYPWQPTSGHAYRRAALEQVLPLPAQEHRTAADSYLAELVPLLGRVAVLPRTGFQYRVHGANDSLAGELDGAWFRTRIARIAQVHPHVRALAQRRGLHPVPQDVRDPLDPALLSYRLASLRLDPERHPFPGDRRTVLAAQGVRASVTHPLLTWRSRLVRSAWFVAVAAAPDATARHVIRTRTPDVPRTTRRQVAAASAPPAAPGGPDADVPLDPSGAWVELLGDVRGARVVLVDALGSAAHELLRAAGAEVTAAGPADLRHQAPADVVVLAGDAGPRLVADAVRCLGPAGVLLLVHDNALSPLAALDALRRRARAGRRSLRSTRATLRAAGAPVRAEYALLRSCAFPSTAWRLDSPGAAATVLDGSNTLNTGLRRRAVTALRWAATHGLAPLLVPGVAVIAAPRPLRQPPPVGRIGVLGSHQAKLLHGEPVDAVEKVYSSARVAQAEADALEQVDRAWPGLAPRLLARLGTRRNLVTWTPGRTLPVDDLAADAAERWLCRAAALLGELHRRLPPAPDGQALVHGDYWLGNLLVDDAGREVVGVIDWTEAGRGHPATDLDHLVGTWVARRRLDPSTAARLRSAVDQAYAEALSRQ